METAELKQGLLPLLYEGKEISVRWDCGGDEAFVYTFIDGQQLEYPNEFADSLELFLIQKLNLPSAGEFSHKGEGKLQLEHNQIVITYSYAYLEVIDYDGVTATYSQGEQYTGREVLMEI